MPNLLDKASGTILLCHPNHSKLPPVEAEIISYLRQGTEAIGLFIQYKGECYYRKFTFPELEQLIGETNAKK